MTESRMKHIFDELVNHLSECNYDEEDFAMALYGVGFNPVEIKEQLYERGGFDYTIGDIYNAINSLLHSTPTWVNDYDVDYIRDGRYRVRKYGDEGHFIIEINDTMRKIEDDDWYWVCEYMNAIQYEYLIDADSE